MLPLGYFFDKKFDLYFINNINGNKMSSTRPYDGIINNDYWHSVRVESKAEKMIRIKRMTEQYEPKIFDIYTNLRCCPSDNIEGRNWMTFICLSKKYNGFPGDAMTIINQFLNWIPAGCWNNVVVNYCRECGIGFVLNSIGYYMRRFCSFRCYEFKCRRSIIEDYDISIELFILPRLKNTTDGIDMDFDDEYYENDDFEDNIYTYRMWLSECFKPEICHELEALKRSCIELL